LAADIARELHDSLGQSLTAVKINLQACLRPSAQLNGQVLEENIRIVDDALAQVRNLALGLRPPMLDDLGLDAALQWVIGSFGAKSDTVINFNSTLHGMRPNPAIEVACFRIAQEALTNAQRHANASLIDIRIEASDHELVLTIVDNGVGFAVAAAQQQAASGRSIGMLGMRERCTLVGGRLKIRSSPGHGCTVTARFPLAMPAPLFADTHKPDSAASTP